MPPEPGQVAESHSGVYTCPSPSAPSMTISGEEKEKREVDKAEDPQSHHDDPEQTPEKTLSSTRKIVLGGVMMCTYFLASATTSSSLLIIPSMARDLDITELAAQWVTSAFTLANGCGLLVAGRLADMYGRKTLFLLGLLINGSATLGSAFIRQHIALCVVRALAGLGQALAMPAGFGIVGVTYTGDKERNLAFAMMGLGYPLGSSLGPLFGGLIADLGGRAWSYQFFLLAGLAFMVTGLGYVVIRPDSGQRGDVERRVDFVGAVLITCSLVLFNFSLTQSGLLREGWKEPYIPALIAVSLGLLLLFGYWEHRLPTFSATPPLIHLTLFRRHNWLVTYILLIALTAYTAISGWLYMTTIWYQTYKGESAVQNVLHVLPAPIVGMFVCLLVPYVAPRVRAPVLLFLGGFMTAAACWLFPVEPPGTSYWACEFIANLVNPFGADFTMGIGSILVSNLAEGHEQSVLGAVFQTAIQLSGTIGVCLSSLVHEVVYRKTENLHHALSVAWWVLAGFSWLSCVLVVATPMRKVGLAKDVGRI